MLETVKRLVETPTKHADVRCTIHSRGLRFVVETHPIRGSSATAIEHIDWKILDMAASVDVANTMLEDAYGRAIASADHIVDEGPVVRLIGGPRDGDLIGWSGEGTTIKVDEGKSIPGLGFYDGKNPPTLPRTGTYRKGRSGEFHWEGWDHG